MSLHNHHMVPQAATTDPPMVSPPPSTCTTPPQLMLWQTPTKHLTMYTPGNPLCTPPLQYCPLLCRWDRRSDQPGSIHVDRSAQVETIVLVMTEGGEGHKWTASEFAAAFNTMRQRKDRYELEEDATRSIPLHPSQAEIFFQMMAVDGVVTQAPPLTTTPPGLSTPTEWISTNKLFN